MRRLDYLVGQLMVVLLLFSAGLLSAGNSFDDKTFVIAIPLMLVAVAYSIFIALRRLEDIGVQNKNAAFMFLFGTAVVANGLAEINSTLRVGMGLLVLCFLLLAPTFHE